MKEDFVSNVAFRFFTNKPKKVSSHASGKHYSDTKSTKLYPSTVPDWEFTFMHRIRSIVVYHSRIYRSRRSLRAWLSNSKISAGTPTCFQRRQMAAGALAPPHARIEKSAATSCLIWRSVRGSRADVNVLTQSRHLLERRDTLVGEIQLGILDLTGLVQHLLRLWHLPRRNTRHWRGLIHCARNRLAEGGRAASDRAFYQRERLRAVMRYAFLKTSARHGMICSLKKRM